MTAQPDYSTDKLVIKYLLCGGAVGGLIMGAFALPRQPEKGGVEVGEWLRRMTFQAAFGVSQTLV